MYFNIVGVFVINNEGVIETRAEGANEGVLLASLVWIDGENEGVGVIVVTKEGDIDGPIDGITLGSKVGNIVGVFVGIIVGLFVGIFG